jgi:hypothetical protein
VVAIISGVAAGGALLLAIAGSQLGFLACGGHYSLGADLPRCRWPAVWADLGAVLVLLALVSLGVGVVLHLNRRKRLDHSQKTL